MKIAITGEGIISAIGLNKAEALQSLRSDRSGIGAMHHLQSEHRDLPVGEVAMSNARMKSALGIEPESQVSRTALMGMMAIAEAVDDAGMKTSAKDGKVVLVNGTTVGGMDLSEKNFDAIIAGGQPGSLGQHDCGSCTKKTAEYFGEFFDEVTTISTACSSAANAIMLGARLIAAGEAEVVVAGGSEALSLFHLNGFNSLMILDHQQCRPFDATRSGLNLGEGAAYVVLESERSVIRRGVEPHAWIAGYGNACDAFHQTATSPDGEGAVLAMQQALHVAGMAASEIDYVNAHGTGTQNNDSSESSALRRVFGEEMPLVSSTKGFTGHTTSAAGSIEAVISLLAMRNSFVPANIGWKESIDDCIVPTMGVSNVSIGKVMCNSFGFGGNDTSLIFSSSAVDIEETSKSEVEVKTLSVAQINGETELGEIRNYVKPLEARRMGPLQKAAFITSKRALKDAGIDKPDAIITGTAYGCLDNSERILMSMRDEGESAVKPTLFMQSTHNTIGSEIAIRLGCHGYNITYTQCDESLKWAIRDAKMLIRSGVCRTVLVGVHDEMTPVLSKLLGYESTDRVSSLSMVLSC